ncbi:MAG: biotin-dependent carboxyltransferase family protein, partial [Thermodesulfobacteriota bacterium]
MKTLRIIRPGPMTTVQDQGRYGFQDRGVPVSGAMDQAAYRLGNLLAGNSGKEASLEITVGGFVAEFLRATWFAVTGAEQEARLNKQIISTWSALQGAKGDVLSLDFGRKGARWYVAMAGGMDVPLVMGSRSTYLRGGFGGLEGRALRKGDVLESGPPMGVGIFSSLPAELIPNYSHGPILRVVLGPQDDEIAEEGMNTFLTAHYTVTQRSDRMGCLLA